MPLQSTQMSVRELLEMVFANKWLFLLCTVMGFVVSYYVSESKVKRYRSTAQIFLKNPIMENPITNGIAEEETEGFDDAANFNFRFQKLSALVLQKERVEAMSKELNLHNFDPNSLSITVSNLTITVSSSRPGESGASEAQKIANYMAQMMINEYGMVRDEHLASDIAYLRKLRDGYAESLRSAKLSLENFDEIRKLNQVGSVVEIQQGLDNINASIMSLDAMLEQYSDLRSQHIQNSFDLTNFQEQKINVIQQISELPAEIPKERKEIQNLVYQKLAESYANAVDELAKKRLERSDIHPDVLAAVEKVNKLKRDLDNADKPEVESEIFVANPVVQNLNLVRSGLETDIVALQGEQKKIESEIEKLGERIDKSDETEEMLLEREDLENEFAQQKNISADLTHRIASLVLTANMNKSNRSMHLSWQKHADLALTPYGSDRNFILAMGTFIGVVIGLVLCFAREFTDTSFRNIDDASRFLDLPVLGVIPEVVGTPRRRRIRKQKRGL